MIYPALQGYQDMPITKGMYTCIVLNKKNFTRTLTLDRV